ncbi:hypothetical protein [Methylovorus mays]|uniref:hypothetical protein n=1 Tax=Methylovorus mays TaxID=184077 RepID=UPI001E629D15|nr:hypothetical protein [Methylovorus mays]MCB5205767.1 hypothetical protein [Methylovorus mays]
MDITLINQLATGMRMAIESIPKDKLPLPMSHFPKGACGDATLLLGAYFADNGITEFQYVCGERGVKEDRTWSTHAWLESEGLVVDITADQFEEIDEKVIVAYGSPWHSQLDGKPSGCGDFRKWSGPGTHHLYSAYGQILSLLAFNKNHEPSL